MNSNFENRISSTSNCNLKVQMIKDSQSDINRLHIGQKDYNKSLTEQQPNKLVSPPMRRENEYYEPIRALGIQQLYQDQRGITLQKLPQDLETQYSQDIPSLLSILTSIYPFDEISSNVLYDYEINNFPELYGISNVRPILASDDDYVFWLEDTTSAIYIWSRIDNSMLYIGQDLREALINYLFHHDNICSVIEFTHEIIPRNEVRQKARELAESYEHITLEVTKELLKPLKGDRKKKKKKKGKKKNKH
ncbi:hypothetical protein C1645_737806 [Glomus cerebriforme]|uniref:Uncharacterized protein n=1 Tax=Glomus cerebriforme TaxID=658196 RepID=A0A397SZQ5_9GLOM|nr:hypothetical protein C1645_737806 [Glomus cerebriforme]